MEGNATASGDGDGQRTTDNGEKKERARIKMSIILMLMFLMYCSIARMTNLVLVKRKQAQDAKHAGFCGEGREGEEIQGEGEGPLT